MAFSHLEQLISEYLEWQGYLIKRNVKVGKLQHGGWEMELDIIGYHPVENKLVHFEPSIDAQPWETREIRYRKKFQAGRKHIREAIFKWIPDGIELEQFAVFTNHPKNRHTIAGGRIISIDELASEIARKVGEKGLMSSNAIQESYPLLRTIQLVRNGYFRIVEQSKDEASIAIPEPTSDSEVWDAKAWHLNIKQKWYETRVNGAQKSDRISFGVTNRKNEKNQAGNSRA